MTKISWVCIQTILTYFEQLIPKMSSVVFYHPPIFCENVMESCSYCCSARDKVKSFPGLWNGDVFLYLMLLNPKITSDFFVITLQFSLIFSGITFGVSCSRACTPIPEKVGPSGELEGHKKNLRSVSSFHRPGKHLTLFLANREEQLSTVFSHKIGGSQKKTEIIF